MEHFELIIGTIVVCAIIQIVTVVGFLHLMTRHWGTYEAVHRQAREAEREACDQALTARGLTCSIFSPRPTSPSSSRS